MDKDMLQPDGTVAFPIKLPPSPPSGDTTSSAVGPKTKTAIIHRERKDTHDANEFTGGWLSTLRDSILPLVSAAVALVGEAISMLNRPGRR